MRPRLITPPSTRHDKPLFRWSSKSICVITKYFTPNDLKTMPVARGTHTSYPDTIRHESKDSNRRLFSSGQISRFVYFSR